MTPDDIHVVYRSSKRVTPNQLDRLETAFGAELPCGFREFLTKLGHGWINDWMQFYCPDANLLQVQRESMIEWFDCLPTLHCQGAKIKRADIESAIQIGIDQDVTKFFACKRFPGSVFEWSNLWITRHKTGLERLDKIGGLGDEPFLYYVPLEPIPENRSLACRSKKLDVHDVISTIEKHCRGGAIVVDVDEGPEPGSRTPAFWVFPNKLGVKFKVYAVEQGKVRRVYITLCTSPKLLPKVESLVDTVAESLGITFKPAAWH